MEATDNYLQQLSGKRRTYEDLSRFVGSRATGIANYTLLLGAGCSVSSNVRSGSSLIEQWRRDVFARIYPDELYEVDKAIDWLSKNQASWYNAQREYSSLFEKNFDLPRQRRMFVEQEVAGKSPNLGYAYLIRLIEEGLINTVFTTNFDDLINEAFFQFSKTRPVICAHDSSIGSVTVTSKRPKVIKLHGDYLFDDIKSTVRETESLEDNTRKKFIEFGRDFGLVVVGYGGHDRSVMDVLQYLLRSDDYFKHGIYWCLRKGEKPSEELLKLLWRERVYYVEIEGFDELMASLHNDLIGKALPIDTGVITNKPRTIISGFCENAFLNDSPSEIIKRDLDRLRKQDGREHLFNVMREMRQERDGKDASESNVLGEKELVTVIEINQLLSTSEFETARTRILTELAGKPSNKLKEELSEFRVSVEELAGDLPAAVAAVDTLIAEDVQEPENYIRKTYLTNDHTERIKILEAAECIDPYNYRVHGRKADCYIDAYNAGAGFNRQELMAAIEESFSKCWQLEPGSRNPSWATALEFYANCGLKKEEVKEKLDELVSKTGLLGASRTLSLRARLWRLSKYKEDRNTHAADTLLADISQARLSRSKSMQPHYEWLELDAYKRLDRKEELSKRISELAVNQDLSKSREYLRRKAEFLMRFSGDIHGSTGAMREAVEASGSITDIHRLAHLLQLNSDAKGFKFIWESHSTKLRPLDKILIKRFECLAQGDIDGALAQLRATYPKRLIGASERVEEVHDLLLLKRYPEAANIARETLEQLNWNKAEFGEHVINLELANLRSGETVSKKKLGEVVDSSQTESVIGCAYYLLGETEKAKNTLVAEIRQDRENAFAFPSWAIFNDEKGKVFIEKAIKAAA